MWKQYRWRLPALALVAAAMLVGLAGCAGSGAKTASDGMTEDGGRMTLKIGYLPITHSAPVMVADAGGKELLGDTKIELVKFASWPELTEALNSGKLDGAVTMLELAMASRANGVPLKVVALSHRGGDAITVRTDVKNLAQVRGKRFAIPHRMSGQNILLKLALEREGLTLDDLQRVEMTPADMPAALARGDIEGYVVAEPFGTMSLVNGTGKILYRADDLWKDWPCCALVMRGDTIDKYGMDVQGLVTAFVKAGASIDSDQATAAKTASAYTKYAAAVWLKSFDVGVRYGDLTPKASELQKLVDTLTSMKLLDKAVPVNDLLDTSFVTKAYGASM